MTVECVLLWFLSGINHGHKVHNKMTVCHARGQSSTWIIDFFNAGVLYNPGIILRPLFFIPYHLATALVRAG